MRKLLFIVGILGLILNEFFTIYYIMPFPGSQQTSTIATAYFFHSYSWLFRLVGLLLLIPFFRKEFIPSRWYTKVIFSLLLVVYGFAYYMSKYEFPAEAMFKPMTKAQMADVAENKIPLDKLVLGVSYQNQYRAYPIEVIGYHHQVADVVNKQTILATYCTVCRTGRVYSPVVNKKPETFRLVGMDSFNAMFEDKTTGSWWQQATGICVAGPLKGQHLKEIFAQQISLGEWIKLHPETKILQEDKNFVSDYSALNLYDEGTIQSSLEGTNFKSWEKKSWVVGILTKKQSYAVDWNWLKQKRIVQNKDFVLLLKADQKSFYAFDNNRHSNFSLDTITMELTDTETQSKWNPKGVCYEGKLAGSFLNPVAAYQEFWHSWQSFHPESKVIGK